MGDIIDDVLKAEERAEEIIREARKRETEMRRAIEEELSAMQATANERAQKLMEQRLERVQMEANKAYDEAVTTAEEENKQFFRRSKRQLERIVNEIVRYVITPEYKRK